MFRLFRFNRVSIPTPPALPAATVDPAQEAACANAPMMICGTDYFLDLTPAKVDVILGDLRKRFAERKRQKV